MSFFYLCCCMMSAGVSMLILFFNILCIYHIHIFLNNWMVYLSCHFMLITISVLNLYSVCLKTYRNLKGTFKKSLSGSFTLFGFMLLKWYIISKVQFYVLNFQNFNTYSYALTNYNYKTLLTIVII